MGKVFPTKTHTKVWSYYVLTFWPFFTLDILIKMVVIRKKSVSDDDSIHNFVADGDDFNDVILAFMDDEKEAERPTRTCLGRSITRRSEVEFCRALILFKSCDYMLYYAP